MLIFLHCSTCHLPGRCEILHSKGIIASSSVLAVEEDDEKFQLFYKGGVKGNH